MSRAAIRYVVGEAARRYGDLEPRTIEYLQRNIRRNLGPRVARDKVLALFLHYKKMYADAARLLPRFLDPPRGRYCDWKDVRVDELKVAIAGAYPAEDAETVDTIAWYVVFYEYLK